MDELVVISGKGGTGKTSVVAALASLAENAVLADCDVDASNLHLVLAPKVNAQQPFSGGSEASIDPELCTGCGLCEAACRFEAITMQSPNGKNTSVASVNGMACEGCAVCAQVCPNSAVALTPAATGDWFTSSTRFGPLVHARLGIGAENSGKLVAVVRKEAQRLAKQQGRAQVLIDGPPGIGCPVIASLTGATRVLIVTEPTPAGKHDLERVLELTSHFKLPALVCVNKYDLNPDQSKEIEQVASAHGARVIGTIRYDRAVTEAQMAGIPVTETESGAAEDMRSLWNALNNTN